MFKSLFTILAILFCSLSIGQYDMESAKDSSDLKEPKINATEIKKRIYVGGDISASFGNALYFYTSPIAGYELYKGISVGATGMYQLFRQTFTNGASISSHAYGGGVFVRYRPEFFKYLLLQTEFDIYNAEDFTTPIAGDRVNLPAFYGGIGYAGGFGRSYSQIMLMYDFANNINNPLPKLVTNFPLYIRVGIVFYLG